VEATTLTGSSIDNPSFSADVTIKFNGAGSWTFTFPPGTNLLSLSGFYRLDEGLNITFYAKTKVTPITVVTLPIGGPGAKGNRGSAFVSTGDVFEDQQSSLQQIRQQLKNLKAVTTSP
jgi:hypothetical protein